MKTSRQKILDYFRLHSTASASDLSRSMQMTPANARHHVNILVEQGALIQIGERMPLKKRGRPERVYRLAESMRTNNLGLLASLLLKNCFPSDDPANLHSQLQALSTGFIEWAGGAFSQRSLGTRLVNAVQILNRLNYQARWEARPEAPEIYLSYCPYREIIVDHPELCQLDAILLQQLTALPAEQTARLTPDRSGGVFCRFQLRIKSIVNS